MRKSDQFIVIQACEMGKKTEIRISVKNPSLLAKLFFVFNSIASLRQIMIKNSCLVFTEPRKKYRRFVKFNSERWGIKLAGFASC